MSHHYEGGGKLTTGEILREITGGETQDPLHGIPEAIGTSEDFPLTTRPGEYLGQPRDYTAVEHHSTPEGVEQTVKMVAIHAALNQPSRLEIAIAELVLIEARLRHCADVRGSVALRQLGEDIGSVRKALETL